MYRSFEHGGARSGKSECAEQKREKKKSHTGWIKAQDYGLACRNPDTEYGGYCKTDGGRGSPEGQINRALQLVIERSP